MHEQNSFLTLTYDKEHLPEDRSVNVEHWQDFAKALRYHSGNFRYYHCGEYGDKGKRPHYHACIFGLDFRDDRVFWKMSGTGFPLYRSRSLERAWTRGHCYIGELTFETAAYVARYCMKKITGRRAEAHYGGRLPEYATMSLRPGIGSSWYDKYGEHTHQLDSVVINGKEQRVPRYYDVLLDRKNPKELERLKLLRVENATRFIDEQTPERLRDREICHEARMGDFRERHDTEGEW